MAAGPNWSSDAKLTVYPIESVDRDELSGRSIFSVAATIDTSSSVNTIHG